MKIVKQSVLLSMCLLAVMSCQKKIDPKEAFAQIDGKVYSQADFRNFQSMQRNYPTQMGELFPGSRSAATAFVEVVALSRKAGGATAASVENSADWKWKKIYFPGQMYIKDVLAQSFGVSDKEIEQYYNSNKDEFKVVFKVPVKTDSPAGDTAAPQPEPQTRDSVEYRALDMVRVEIAKKLFLQQNPPPAEFYTPPSSESADDTQGPVPVDSAMAVERYFASVRSDLPMFFMKKYFTEKYNKPFPDSLEEWYGEGKVITQADFDVILNWLPEGRRETYNNTQGIRFLAQWLLKWKLFAEKAQQSGYTAKPEIVEILKWAKEFEVASKYVQNRLVPEVTRSIRLDTAMCTFALWDKEIEPGLEPDSAALQRTMDEWFQEARAAGLDKAIHEIRTQKKVQFLQNEWRDEKDKSPAQLAAKADSLLNVGESAAAEDIYKKLERDFRFTKEGMNALLELAKINTESEKYKQAVRYYRSYLVLSGETDKQCNTFFMIGFIYDEYLDKPKHAAVNYRWILKNAADCELADDAEFMVLHLDEPMIGVEELQAEARRQGRKVEEGAETSADTSAAAL